jgi:hypothetical protein
MNSEMLVKSATKYIFSFGKLSPRNNEPKTIIPENIAYQFVL